MIRGNRRLRELKDSVFDTEGYFDPKNIKPLSIETGMLSVGTKGSNFIVEDLLVEPNYKGNPKAVNLSSGKLTHFTIDSSPKSWSIPAANFDLDDDEALYYIYARCAKGSPQGLWRLSQEKIKTEGRGDDYFFLLGVIHSVTDEVRGVSLTYGQSALNGRFITTGKIKSADGHSFMDLDHNQFAIGNETSGIDWNKSEKDTLTIKGAVIQKGSAADCVIKEGKITSRDKRASLNSEDGKFSIVKNQITGEKTELSTEEKTEISKDGLYAGHAGSGGEV